MNDVRSPGAAIQSDAFISRLRYVDSKYVVGVQQDAEEFMAPAFVTMASSTVTCQLCHSLYDEIARKSQAIFHWPSIVMHAFGFKLVEQRHYDTKICMIMEYPETLDIGPFIVPEDQSHSSSRYTLYGLIFFHVWMEKYFF
ncbi:unnamed protein product [Didymodactylos carnosus]|uniref:Uncharacterized protein n=1 Tax=Didymodactylos carnosus TaxID=1234261 RepID=A0A8S2DV79_9BILA|nr:unnamed protein product [Didymodactylos carnosus]CAF3826798.1 unnamed protein product [Didymodactylos carnosus]